MREDDKSPLFSRLQSMLQPDWSPTFNGKDPMLFNSIFHSFPQLSQTFAGDGAPHFAALQARLGPSGTLVDGLLDLRSDGLQFGRRGGAVPQSAQFSIQILLGGWTSQLVPGLNNLVRAVFEHVVAWYSMRLV